MYVVIQLENDVTQWRGKIIIFLHITLFTCRVHEEPKYRISLHRRKVIADERTSVNHRRPVLSCETLYILWSLSFWFSILFSIYFGCVGDGSQQVA